MRWTRNIWTIIWFSHIILVCVLRFIDISSRNIVIWTKIGQTIFSLLISILAIRYLQIIQYIQLLGVRFELINLRLEEINSCKFRLNTRDSNFSEENVYNEIVSLRKMYHILWANTRESNIFFKWSLLLLIAGSFIITVVNYYQILVWLLFYKSIPVEKKLNFYGIFMIWTIGQTFYIVSLTSICHNVSQQVNSIILLINYYSSVSDTDSVFIRFLEFLIFLGSKDINFVT